MDKSLKINLRSINAFKEIGAESLQKLESNVEIVNYPIGFPISSDQIIPNKIIVILSGNIRFLTNNLASETITKASSGTFVGLSSILRAEACEKVIASSKVMALICPDYLILELYNKEKTFNNWCNTTMQSPEIAFLAQRLISTSSRSDLYLKDVFNQLESNLNLKIYTNGDHIKLKDNEIQLVGSANFENKTIGDILDNNNEVKLRGNLPCRIFSLSKSVLNQILINESTSRLIKDEKNNNDKTLSTLKINENLPLINPTNEKVGRYSPEETFKIIRAKGEIRETLACLKMISNSLNLPYKTDAIEKILRDSKKRNNKFSIQLLGGITSMLGLHATSSTVHPSLGSRIPTPAIISWKNSFAVVKESNAKFLEIVSPSEGLIRIQKEDLESSFDKGFIEILIVEKNDHTQERKFGFQWLFPAIKRYRNSLIQVFLASFVVQLFGLANPLMIQVIIDKVISQRSLDTLQILGFALVFITIIGGILSSLRTFLFNETTNRIDTRLGAEVIDHLLRLPLNYFDRRPVGELGSRIAELEKIRNFLTGQALTTILDAAFSLIYIVVMVIYSWLLTLIALGVVPIQILITIIGAPLIRGQIRDIAKENAKTQSHLVEVLTGIQTVKAQNIERISRWKWQELYGQYISKSFQKTLTGTALGETSQVLQQLSQLLVLWVGAVLVLKGQLSLGQLIAFRIISGYVTQPLLRLSTIWQNIQELRVSFERLADVVDTPEEASKTNRSNIPLPSVKGKIQFNNVSFAFAKGQTQILKNINLEVKPGQFIGIVGQSGSGKSTLMKLLPRLYKPDSGRILIDGNDIEKVELYSLRRQVGIVPQEPLLFAGSVSDNISLTDPEATSDEIVRVSSVANAHDFIMELPDGYSTNIGERGAGLSGGQKQRIAIARTLLSNPRLLILDEATSALDYQTERNVCEGLRSECKGSTVFFITHRLNTVKNADVIVLLHQGCIEEMGTHDQLMSLKGRYFALYRQQESS